MPPARSLLWVDFLILVSLSTAVKFRNCRQFTGKCSLILVNLSLPLAVYSLVSIYFFLALAPSKPSCAFLALTVLCFCCLAPQCRMSSPLLVDSVVSGLPRGAHVAATAHPSSSAPHSAPEASLYAGHWVSFACPFALMTFSIRPLSATLFSSVYSWLFPQ